MEPLSATILVVGISAIVGGIVVLVNGFACDLWNQQNNAYTKCVAATGGPGCIPPGPKPNNCDCNTAL